jgi:hypothetical protein
MYIFSLTTPPGPGQYRNVQDRVPRCPSQYRDVQVPRCLGFVSNPCNCREKGITNKDFLSTFGKMIKNKTLKEVHNYFIEIFGFDEKSSEAALNNKYKKMTEIKSNLQKNKEYDELDRFLKLPFSLPQCHQKNKHAHKRKADTNATFTEFSDFRHFKKKLHIAESKLEISCNIIDDCSFRQQI